MMFMNPKNIAVLKIHSVDYDCVIYGISKSEAVNLLKNPDVSKKG